VSAPVKAVSEEKATLMIYLPTEVRDQFKTLCAANGQSMSAVVVAFIEDMLQRHSPAQDVEGR